MPARPSSSAGALIPVSGRTRQEIIAEDVRDLARLGYAQQLFREMGGFSNFAISFSIISVLTGAVLLFGSMLAVAAALAAYWRVWARHRFVGPLDGS